MGTTTPKQPTPTKVENENPAEGAARVAAERKADAEAAAPEKAKTVAERGDPVVAVNLITQTGDDGHAEDITPGTVFCPAKVDIAFLVANGAIREPTKGELAIYDALQKNVVASADETLG